LFAPNEIAPVVAGSLTATRATTGTYVDRYGVVKTASADEMREESEGWLIEGESTNLALYSEQFDNGAWAKTGSATVTANATSAPDGNATADRIDFTADNETVAQFLSNSTVSNFTFSLWVKSPSTDRDFELTIRNTPTTSNRTDLIFTATSDWKRFDVSFLSLSENIACEIRSKAGNLDIDVWGAQLEQQSAASSYIPTTTAPVTRSADLLSIPVYDNLFSGVFSIVCNFALNDFQGNFNAIIARVQPVTNIVLDVGVHNYSSGKVRINYNNAFSDQNTTSKSSAVFIFDGLNVTSYLDGIAGASATSAAIIENENNLVIGSSSTTGVNPLNGHLKDFRIYDFALNADEVKYLSGVV